MSPDTVTPTTTESRPASTTGVYVGNTLANCLGYGAKVAVTFFLSPYVVHTLGDTAYGTWVLLVSITGYMGLLDIGATTSISRYINFYIAKNEQKRLDAVISTAVYAYLLLTFALAAVAVVLGFFLRGLFPHLPADLTAQARVILVIISANITLGLISGIFRQLLAARDRFDIINIVSIGVLLFNALATVLALRFGWSIVGLAGVQLASTLLALVVSFSQAKRRGPSFAVERSAVSSKTFKEIMSFGAYAFIADVGVQLVYYTNSLVIGSLIGAAAVTFYNIPFMLVDYGRSAVKQVRAVLIPDLLKTGARSDPNEMQWVLQKTTRFLMIFTVPAILGITLFGRDFIGRWMGPEYAKHYFVLIVLALPQLAVIAALPCATLLLGMGQVRLLAACVFAEGITNLGLSIALVVVFHLGIEGVALATLPPAIIFSSLLVPLVACRSARLSLRDYVRRTTVPWVAASLLAALPYILVPSLGRFSEWSSFLLKGALFLLYCTPIIYFALLTKHERSQVRTSINGFRTRLPGLAGSL